MWLMGVRVIGPFNDELFVLRIITMKFYDLDEMTVVENE